MKRRKDADRVWILRRRRGPRRVERFDSGVAALAALDRTHDVELIVAADQLDDISWRGFFAQAARSQPGAYRVLARSPAGIEEPDNDSVDSTIEVPVTPGLLDELAQLAARTRRLREQLTRARQGLRTAESALDAAFDAQRALLDMLAGTVEATAYTLDGLFEHDRGGGRHPARLLRIWRRWLSLIDLQEQRLTADRAPERLVDLVHGAASAAQVEVVNAVAADGVGVVDRVHATRVLTLLFSAAAELCPQRPLQVAGRRGELGVVLGGATCSATDLERALAGTLAARPPPLWALELCLCRRLGEHAGFALEARVARGGTPEIVLLMQPLR